MRLSNKLPIIIGIDPGTTLAYSIIDIYGNVLAVKSAKQIKISDLILELIHYGKIVIVATDVNPAGSIAKKIAKRNGAKLVQPNTALTTKEKKKLVAKLKYRNTHQRDALAAAIYAYKRTRSLLKKVDIVMTRQSRQEQAEIVKEMVLTKPGMSIARATHIIEV